MSWQATYYANMGFGGGALANVVEANIDHKDGNSLPDAVKSRPHYISVRYRKQVNGPGRFRVSVVADDGVRFHVDGRCIINAWRDQAPTPYSAEYQLSAGPHELVAEFYQRHGGLRFYVNIEKLSNAGAQSYWDRRVAQAQVNATGHLTRGGLEAARLYEVDEDGYPLRHSPYGILYCMFNPKSYKVKKSSAAQLKGIYSSSYYGVEADRAKLKPRELQLKELWFDTSETNVSHGQWQSVAPFIDHLASFAESTSLKYGTTPNHYRSTLAPPPKIAFQWGSFRFLGVITSLKSKFTHFSPHGLPLRAKVTLKMLEFRHRQAYRRQNPTSGGEATLQMWQVKGGDWLDTIAAAVYGRATLWPQIAAYNGIVNPFALPAGMTLQIPPLDEHEDAHE